MSLIELKCKDHPRTNHFGRKFLEQFADQTPWGISVGHYSLQELLQDLLQTAGWGLKDTEDTIC